MIKVKLTQKAKNLRKDGTAPIYFVLSRGRDWKLISTKKYIEPQYFDNATGQVLKGAGNSVKLNNYFRAQMTRLDTIIMELATEGKEVSFEKVEEIFNNDYGKDFIAFAFKELDAQRGLISPKTYEGYRERLNALKRYRASIPFNAITYTFLTEYRHYLVTVQKRKMNGYYQDFATIKKFHRIAVLKGEATGNPFANFKLTREETIKNWLTEGELVKLHTLLQTDRVSEAEKNTLRHFLFCCYTGIRFGDKKRLTTDHIVNDRLTIQTSKTGKFISIPFNSLAKGLLEDVLKRKLKQRNKMVNRDLDVCMQAAEINKKITFHCSRHTFAINCILLGIDIITVRDWLGHTSVTTTEIYAKIAQQYTDQNMKKWEAFGLQKVS